jgi:protein involved in polysaccharide export with SLBB domain/beta-lactamase regulating signal transducer with metallopeptidase domain
MTTSLARAILAVSASIDASIVVKATLVLAVPLVALRFVARGTRASVRHAILAATFGVLLILPAAALVMPRVVVAIPVARQVSAPTPRLPMAVAPRAIETAGIVAREPRVVAHAFQWPAPSALFRSAWVMGAFLFLVPLAIPLWRLRSVRRRGRTWVAGEKHVQQLAVRAGIRQPLDVLLHDDIVVPVTYGVTRPVILLPLDVERWNSAEIEQAVVHELEHVRRREWPTILFARVVCAMYWFHPLAWIGLRALSLESERACDDAVVGVADHAAYADQLLKLAERLSNGIAHPVLSMANRSQLAARIAAILNRDQRRGQTSMMFAAVISATAVAVVLALAPLSAVARMAASPVRDMTIELPANAAVASPDATPAAVTIAPVRQIPRTVQISQALAPPTPVVQIPVPQPAPAPVAQPASPDASSQATDSYVIRPNDTLSIAGVDDRGSPQINKFKVAEDGTVTVPFLGRMPAGGKTIRQFQDELAKRLAAGRFVVRTDVDQPKNGIVYVTGAVRTPTTVQMQGTLTLMGALVQAGSPRPDAGDEVQITHKGGADVTHVRMRDLNLGGGDLSLQDGDIVFVPGAKHFTMTGQVRNPGAYVWTSGLTIEKAIAIAGGTTDRASMRRTIVRRLVDGKTKDVDVTITEEVLPDDVVLIASRIF